MADELAPAQLSELQPYELQPLDGSPWTPIKLIFDDISAMTERVREHWAAVGTPTKDPEELLPQEAAIKDARKQLNKIINWSLNDDKHLKIHQIHDTVKYLQQMTDNILAHPTTDKFRR